MSLFIKIDHSQGAFDLDVDIRIDSKGLTALFGPSGSGKSTIINAVAGLFRPRSGHIAVDDRVLFDAQERIFIPTRHRRLGYVFQDGRLFPHLSVESNLRFGWKRAEDKLSEPAIEAIIDRLGLHDLLDRKPIHLSGGEAQRVALGRALLANPDILLLDEPLAALDAPRKAEILPYLERLRDDAQVPILYVSHSVDEVSRLADTVVVINDGKVLATGTVFDVMSRIDLFPVTGRFEAGAVLQSRVENHDDESFMSTLSFDEGELVVPRIAADIGAPVRVRIRARDIILSKYIPSNLSANNVLPARVLALRRDPGAFVDIQLQCGQSRLIARITKMSLERLRLVAGMEIFAVIKSVTVDRRTLSADPALPDISTEIGPSD